MPVRDGSVEMPPNILNKEHSFFCVHKSFQCTNNLNTHMPHTTGIPEQTTHIQAFMRILVRRDSSAYR